MIPKKILINNDKRYLASIILRYINEGTLEFNDAVKIQLPTFFNYISKSV